MSEPHAEHQPGGNRTAAQNRALWRLTHALERIYGAGNGELRMRALVREVSGADCTRRLSAVQMRRVLDLLSTEVKKAEKARQAPEPLEPPTTEQQASLEAYRVILGISEIGLQKLSRRVNGDLRPWPQSKAESIKLFEALKAMFGRKLRRETGFARSLELRIEAIARGSVTPWEATLLADVMAKLRAGLVPPVGALRKVIEIENKQRALTHPEAK